MPISLFVFSFLSFLGVASGTVLLLRDFGLVAASSPLMLWVMFLVFSLLGPAGIMMASQRPGRLLVVLGAAFTVLGLAAISAIFVAALGIVPVSLPMLELLLLALLTLPGGVSLFVAGRAAAIAGDVR